MLECLPEEIVPTSSGLNLAKFGFEMLDDFLDKPKKKGQKKKKTGRKKKNRNRKRTSEMERAYAQLAFEYGVRSCEYKLLTRTVELAIAASRGKLNDQLLEFNLKALDRPRHVSLPEF